MKELLAVIAVLLSGALAEAPAPYAPSGWRPSGPAFELPQKNQQEYLPPVDPRRPLNPNTEYGTPEEEDVSVQGLPVQEQVPIFQVSPITGQQYVGPNFNSDLRNLDNSDNFRLNQYQQQQQKYREFERQRQLEAAQARNRVNQVPIPQVPRQFASQTTPNPTETTFSTRNEDFSTTTEPIDLNEGETLDDNKSVDVKKQKVSVEVSKQNLKEYPGELFLSSLAQLQLQPQFVPLEQFGQIRAPLYYQPIQQQTSQKQVAGYDAQTHFAAFPSVLAQQQALLSQPQGVIPSQQRYIQNPALLVASQDQANVGFIQAPQPVNQYEPFNQYQPAVQPQVQNYPQPQIQTFPQPQQPQALNPNQFPQPQQPQGLNPNQFPQPQQPQAFTPNQSPQSQQPKSNDDEEEQEQPQFVYQQSYQPQEVIYQPQSVNQYQSPEQQGFFVTQAQLVNPNQGLDQQYQNGFISQGQLINANQGLDQQYQNGFISQGQLVNANQGLDQQYQNGFIPQAQLVNPKQGIAQQYQNGFVPQQFVVPQAQQVQGQPQTVYQGQDAFLQSGLDPNQQGNDVEQTDDKNIETDDGSEDVGSTATAVATAFGTRTQPRVFTRYGAPVPRVVANPQAATESPQSEPTTENGGAVAEANAFATGRRKSAKLRSRRVRPVFTVDRSGHLVLAQEQN